MLSRKRPILFEVMGHKGRAARARGPETPAPKTRESPVPRRRESAPRRSPKELMATPAVRWAALSLAVALAVTFAIWRLQRPSDTRPPELQTNVRGGAPPAPDQGGAKDRPGEHAFAICVMEKTYATDAERRHAMEKVQEMVDFLGYHSDPAFRDVRGQDCPGTESGTGTFRIYVGSADRKSKLVSLRDKLTNVSWKRIRPFQNASIRLVER
jgi:hypothetical protein